MALGWNKIKDRAARFSKEWAGTGNEDADANPFLIEFFEVFGISRKRVASFEHRVMKLGDLNGAVALAYRPQPFQNETQRIEFLFELYERLTAGIWRERKKVKKYESIF